MNEKTEDDLSLLNIEIKKIPEQKPPNERIISYSLIRNQEEEE